MPAMWTPMRWPSEWKDAALLDLLRDTGINCLLVEGGAEYEALRSQASRLGFAVFDKQGLPSGVTVIKGKWPGVRLALPSASGDRFTAGPTGEPWVDSNGWKIRLAIARQPNQTIWVHAEPQKPWLFAESYLLGVADAATYGGRWIITLDDALAAGIANQKIEAFQTWRWLTAAAKFFSDRTEWRQYRPEAVLGVVSSFAGRDESFSHELLNLIARTNQQYRIILPDGCGPDSFRQLKAVLYLDEQAPGTEVRRDVLAFVRQGGLLIAGPGWGEVPQAVPQKDEHPRYEICRLGEGRIARLKAKFADPYVVAQDSAILISHRYDLLRFWNGGAVGSYMCAAPEKSRVLVQVLFYAGARGRKSTVRVAGRYRTAKLSSFNDPKPKEIEAEMQADAVELHLPPVPQYAAVELEI